MRTAVALCAISQWHPRAPVPRLSRESAGHHRLCFMTVFAGIVLLLNAIYNVIVWPQFWKRVTADPRARDDAGKPTKFYTVHAVLIVIALILAIASAIAGIALLIGG